MRTSPGTKLDESYDYIVFDCAPATKVVSQNAIAASHGYVLPIVPEAVMERGASHFRGMIQSGIDKKLQDWTETGEARSMFVPNTRLIGSVVTRIQTHGRAYSGYTNDHTQHLRRLESKWGNRFVKLYIEHGVGVGEALTVGVPTYERGWAQIVGGRGFDRMFEKLTAEFKARMNEL